jgi:uncharacterized protein (TIGR03067 family)
MMIHKAMMIVGLLTVLASSIVLGSDEKSDQDAVQGTWLGVTAEFAGQKWPEAMAKALQLVIDHDKYLVKDGEATDKGTIKLESSEKVKSMVIKGTDGPNNGKTFLAIYELKGDSLTICYDLEGKELPTEFKTKEKTKQFLVTYKRKKD